MKKVKSFIAIAAFELYIMASIGSKNFTMQTSIQQIGE